MEKVTNDEKPNLIPILREVCADVLPKNLIIKQKYEERNLPRPFRKTVGRNSD
jgi:hypothetical protein